MKFLRLAKKNKENNPELFDAFYGNEIDKLIRKKYSLSEELAILRQRDEKPEEFAEYNAYAEACKEEVKAEIETMN